MNNYRVGRRRPPWGWTAGALVPAVILGALGGWTGLWWLGAAAVLLAVLGGMAAGLTMKGAGRPFHPGLIALLYLAAVAVTWWVPTPDVGVSLARGLLLVAGVAWWSIQELFSSGAESLRQVWTAAKAVQRRGQWPAHLEECVQVPEVQRLRQVVQRYGEIRPVLLLVTSPRPPLQLAALHALAFRTCWYAGEAEHVLQATAHSPHVAIRLALVQTLAGVKGAELLAALTGFLRDPAAEVRQQVAAVLLWRAEERWPLIREAIRDILADPLYPLDGSLFTTFDPAAGLRLPGAAIADLITWAAEPPPLAPRAIVTLITYFRAELQAGLQPELTAELVEWMVHPDTPPALRVELAALLRDFDLLSPELLDRLSNVDQPAPIRLFAAEMLLRINPHDPDGIDVLRGLARQSNRELAVQVALILQTYLGLDFGLDPQTPPAPSSKAAAELTRRLLKWA
ncbi:MAG: HEAT repeat domain-containing protein, partial [Thermogemmata sp.]|nr:HEAT repeat domain-containing protein [Thermogemmata sp.]